jgi:hypothetical protein
MTDSDAHDRESQERRAALERRDELDASEDESEEAGGELPESLVNEARRLTRLARRATVDDEAEAYRADRDEQLADNGFTSRIRAEDDTLVLYPAEWVEDGEVQFERIDDTSRAYELTLSGPGDPDQWDEIEGHNAAVVEIIEEQYGEVHRRNARAFADFMGNHYAREVQTATREEVEEFLTEYYPRNAWPTAAEREAVRESVELVFEVADAPSPL